MSKQKFSQFLGIASLVLAMSACSLPRNDKTSVLVIAVENLGVNQVNCSRDNKQNTHSGFDLLCEESVRFTHGFTSSVLSGPALASILTGQYPAAHGFRHHGRSALSSKIQTIAESAQAKSYATSFFSGGAPVLRKHNLQQGFEIFDDNFTPSLTTFFRSLEKTEPLFKNWLKDIGNKPFFSVLYVPDLLFVDTVTTNDLGESRNLSFESQLEELDETLLSYFHFLKEQKRWDNTVIVLVGLNGPPQKRRNELLNTNLFSERSQIALFIKPPHKPRDEGLSWSIDSNVSLTDVGTTIRDYLLNEIDSSKIPELETVSLRNSILTAQTDWSDDRLIAVESAWPEWKLDSGNPSKSIRFSVRKGYFAVIYNERPRIYNSLIDRFETSTTALNDPSVSTWALDTFKILEKINWSPWSPLKANEIYRWDLLSESMDPLAPPISREEDLKEILQKNPEDSSALSLLVYQLLDKSDWTGLAKWTDLQKLKDNPCLKIFLNKNMSDIKLCEDPLSAELIEWSRDEKSETLRRKFLRSYFYAKIDQKITETNIYLQSIWDTSLKDLNTVRTIDVLLTLPEAQRFAQQAQRYLANHQIKPEEIY